MPVTMRDDEPGAYAAHDHLVAPARNRPELWRIVLGLALVGILVSALNLILFSAIAAIAPYDWTDVLFTGGTPLAMFVLLGSFGFITLGVAVAVRLLQHRAFPSIVGARGPALAQFWKVLRALMILGLIVAVLPPYDMGEPLQTNLSLPVWLMLLPISAFAVLIQTSAEEVLFRGYLQQSLAARFRSPVIWMGVPSLLFAAGHYAPALAGDNALLVAAWSCVFGLLAADLTARAGTLGPAIALHFFNNAVALLFISLPDNLSGLALFLLPYDMSDTGMLRQWLLVDFAVMIVCWLTARLAIRR